MYMGSIIATHPIDLTDVSEIAGFSSDTKCEEFRVLFRVGLKWQKINKEGELEDVPTQDITTMSIFDEGNLLEELAEMTSFPALIGKKIYVAIAAASSTLPTPILDFKINYIKQDVVLSETLESQEYRVRGDIESITPKTVGNVTVEVNGYKNGRWLGWVPADKALENYEKIKFRATLSVDKVGDRSYFENVVLVAKPSDALVPTNTVDIVLRGTYKNATIYVVGNGVGKLRAFCSPAGAASEQWKELEKLTDTSFIGANGTIKIQVTMDTEETPEVNGIVIAEGK